MVRMKTLPGDDGLKFARTTKSRRKPLKKAKTPEKHIQEPVEEYLELLHIEYIRIPDEVYRIIFNKFSDVPVWLQKKIAGYLKGIPDIICLKNGRYLAIEIKTDVGKLSLKQKLWRKAIGTKVARSFDEARELIDNWRGCE